MQFGQKFLRNLPGDTILLHLGMTTTKAAGSYYNDFEKSRVFIRREYQLVQLLTRGKDNAKK